VKRVAVRAAALVDVDVRDQLCAKPKAPNFFVSARRTRLLYACINQVFRRLVDDVGLAASRAATGPSSPDP
jgi:hypothetical protein